MTINEMFVKIRDNSVCEDCCLTDFTKEEIDELLDKVYCNWTDIRKTLDEQMIVNNKMYNNYYIYMAREAEAKAKFLYIKAFRMMMGN